MTNTLHRFNHVTFVMEMNCVFFEVGLIFLHVVLNERHVPVLIKYHFVDFSNDISFIERKSLEHSVVMW
jgi:hypothetical protein